MTINGTYSHERTIGDLDGEFDGDLDGNFDGDSVLQEQKEKG